VRAVDDLAVLAALLHARGYITHLAFSLPVLVVRHPGTGACLRVTAVGSAFCCGGAVLCPRPPVGALVCAAGAIDLAWPAAGQEDA
jgi:hypothetical protein